MNQIRKTRTKALIFTRGGDFFRKATFWPYIKFFFQSNLDQTWSDCSTHKYYNMTKFGQDWTENKKILI